MNYDELSDLIKKTRTVRRFKPGVTIQSEELIDIVDTTRVVSSALNKQPLKYIVVTEKELVNRVSAGAQWASHFKDWDQAERESPCAYIILVNDTSINGYELIDCGIVLQTIMLLLGSKGYAGCALASIDKEQCSSMFSLSDDFQPLLGIAIGVKDEEVYSVDLDENGDTSYYRTEANAHCVPKRSLDEVLLGTF